MAVTVRFRFRTGLWTVPFSHVRLSGTWDARAGLPSPWRDLLMDAATDFDGRPIFRADVTFADDQIGAVIEWGIRLDAAAGADVWAIAAEVDADGNSARTRSFTLRADMPEQSYALTWLGLLGANPVPMPDGGLGIRFAVWAPNAGGVDLVLTDPATGYVDDRGGGVRASIPMTRNGDGIWTVGPAQDPALADFAALVGQPYMVRVTKDDGTTAYRTDIWSLMQIGRGTVDPEGQPYHGAPTDLDGPQSCSVVCDPRHVVRGPNDIVAAAAFWADEFTPDNPLSVRIEDLIIYELHVGALGFGKPDPGTLDDAIAFIDHLEELGVNAVELLPIAQFEKKAGWGYGTSHFFAMHQAAGGTDRLKMFVKACHQRGIAVILDVCYNHFDPDGERVQWAYDSNDPTRNIYYWYEGQPSDYAQPDGGYVDNLSTGYAPRFDVEAVRQLFIASAAFLVETCHVDGFRLDQTSSIHEYPVRHADGRRAERAAAFGVKFLKQWTRTLRLIKPGLFLSAEDYSNWPAMTEPSLAGAGLGFDATWYGDFHHNLVEYQGGAQAQLLKQVGYGDDRPLAMSSFAGALRTSGWAKVVYSASHDDCGNRDGSARTLVTAVSGAPLVGDTRRWGEARVRFAAAMTLLSAGTPMFFMGEEIGAQKPYRYDDFATYREDILGEATGAGAALLRYYTDLIALSRDHPAFRSRDIAMLAPHDRNRVIAFHRWGEGGEYFVAGTLANAAFRSGYWFSSDRLGDAAWTEIFNTDAERYAGWNDGNAGRTLRAVQGALNVILPACGVVVFRRD